MHGRTAALLQARKITFKPPRAKEINGVAGYLFLNTKVLGFGEK